MGENHYDDYLRQVKGAALESMMVEPYQTVNCPGVLMLSPYFCTTQLQK